ncbi:MAG: hypothetical protein MUF38_10790 [Anaerolineae bacterium]|jgi:hypothetical protein|nr:hypothetical protein [Anaerolineae bacterium]
MRAPLSVTRTGAVATFAYTPPMRVYGGVRSLLTLAESVHPFVLAAALRGFWRFSPHTRALVTTHPALEPSMLGANMAEVDLDPLPMRPYAPDGATTTRPVMASHLFADCDGCVTLVSVSAEELAESPLPPSLAVIASYCKMNTDPAAVYAALAPHFAGAIVHIGEKVVWGDDLLDVDATAYRLAGLEPHPLIAELRG